MMMIGDHDGVGGLLGGSSSLLIVPTRITCIVTSSDFDKIFEAYGAAN
jgi:hypothetical protein